MSGCAQFWRPQRYSECDDCSFRSALTMVVEVIYHRLDEGEAVDSSISSSRHVYYDMGRDTSHTYRMAGDDTRQSAQSTSILNCSGETEDDEDDDFEEPGSFLFNDDDFHSPLNQSLDQSFNEEVHALTSSPPSQEKLFCENDRAWLDTSLQNVTDSFVSFCSARAEDPCGFTTIVNSAENCSKQLQHQVEFDLLQLLGCDVPLKKCGASSDMGDVTWFSPLMIKAVPTASNVNGNTRPIVRRNPRQRAERIRRLRNEFMMTGSQHPVVSPTRSMDDHQTLERYIGEGVDAIEQEDGYDSDPGDVLKEVRNDTLRDTSLLDEEESEEYYFYDGHRERLAQEYNMRMAHQGPTDQYDREIYDAVQDAMNMTWTLTWHAQEKPMPMCVHFWVERGTMLNRCNQGPVVVEPKFMWREVYQPSLSKQRLLSESSRKPIDVRVLNTCRIVEANSDLDRSKYPMARSACSLFLKTCRDEVFLFEASSPEEREQIIRHWKLVVARLASLAVIEDMESMVHEFFTPTVNAAHMMTNDS